MTKGNLRWTFFALLTIPFFLNDFANIFVKDYGRWLLIDFIVVKAFPLALIWISIRKGIFSFGDFGLRKIDWTSFFGLTVLMSILGLLIDRYVGAYLYHILPHTNLGTFPQVTNQALLKVDLYVGMVFVGFLEETIFRGLTFTLLTHWISNRWFFLLVSTVFFGLIHWSLGINSIIHTGLVGLVFMTVMWKTGSIWPVVVAHSLVDYVAFSGIFPEALKLFDFMP